MTQDQVKKSNLYSKNPQKYIEKAAVYYDSRKKTGDSRMGIWVKKEQRHRWKEAKKVAQLCLEGRLNYSEISDDSS